MESSLLHKAADFMLARRRRKRWQKIVSGMASVVVFCTTYALILPAITMSDDVVCGLEEHAHTEACWTTQTIYPQSAMACTFAAEGAVAHEHDSLCRSEDGTLICTLERLAPHQHADSCYGEEKTLTCTETEDPGHTHSDACYTSVQGDMTCTQAEDAGHSHGETCYQVTSELTCTDENEEHVHEAGCYTESELLVCLEEEHPGHTHDDSCYSWTREQTCTQEERPAGHVHGDECYQSETVLTCGQEETVAAHQHTQECIIPAQGEPWEEQVLTCGLEVHSHAESCYPAEEQEYVCGYGEHVHGENCYDAEGNLICTLEEHIHTDVCEMENQPTEEELNNVQRVIDKIDAMPSADEIDAALYEYELIEDYEGYEVYYSGVVEQVQLTYSDYYYLTDREKALVTNADKLMELEYIWSAVPLLEEITSAVPTTVGKTGQNPAVSTSEFVTLNIYDYYGAKSASSAGKTNINSLWSNNNKYPGFQWNGGAYMTSSPFSRSRVDNIDFGNSMITDFTYGGTTSGISNGVSSNFQRVGNQGGTINKVIGYTNKPIGYSSGSGYDALRHTLKDGYPALSDGASLSYLFSDSPYAAKKNTSNIDGLFRQNQTTGEYWFDSRKNHAQYGNNRFTLYNQIITPNFILYPFGNFLPFNDITNVDKATQVSAIDYVVQGPNGKSGYMQTIINRLSNGAGVPTDPTEKQLFLMLAQYRNSLDSHLTESRSTWTVEDALVDYFEGSSEFKDDYDYADLFNSADGQDLLSRLYNIDYDVEKNFLFGMDMQMRFMMPNDGMTGNDTNGDGKSDYPMKFYFAGDDDVWVYIDGTLVLDLTGIHRHVGGDIDFVNGVVNYYYMDSYINGAVESTPYLSIGFEDIFSMNDLAAGGTRPSGFANDLNGNAVSGTTAYTFKEFTFHDFNFYYMERGTGSSVCRINFNFPLINKNSITVSKQNVPDDTSVDMVGNPDYYFNIINEVNGASTNLFVGPNSKTGISTYKVMDGSGNYILDETGAAKLFFTDQYGIFKLKAGQTAIFEDIPENAGTYYVQELIKVEDRLQYEDTVKINGVDSRYNNIVNWANRSWITGLATGADGTYGPDGSQWYGYSSQNATADADHAFHFDAQNGVVTKSLGQLAVSKSVTDYNPNARVIRMFNMHVTLDGEPVSVGSTYDVYAATDTGKTNKLRTVAVETAGIITIAADEMAVIENILSGIPFEVWEDGESAAGYAVSYDVTGESADNQISISNGKVTGVIRGWDSTVAGATAPLVRVVVTNSEGGTQISIPINKQLMNASVGSMEKVFSFDVWQQTGTDSWTDIGTNVDITVAPGEGEESGQLLLTYGSEDITWDANNQAQFVYKIKEITGEAGVEYDTSEYLVTVTVTRSGATLTAEITSVTKDGIEVADKNITFVNTLTTYVLPETGGGGTGWYTLAGALIMAGAALLLYKDILRRKEDSLSTS